MATIDANNKPSAVVDTGNVIPFPDRRAARKQPEKTEPRIFSRPLRHVLRRVTNAVLRLVHRRNSPGVQRKRGSGSALAGRYFQHHHAAVLDHHGRAIRQRMSA